MNYYTYFTGELRLLTKLVLKMITQRSKLMLLGI